MDRVNKEIDISTVLRKLHDLEKLKKIVLSPMQLAMFNFIPQPLIQLPRSKRKEAIKYEDRDPRNENPDRFSDYLKYYQHYQILKQNDSEINTNLIQIIDRETLVVFDKIDKLIGEENFVIKKAERGSFRLVPNLGDIHDTKDPSGYLNIEFTNPDALEGEEIPDDTHIQNAPMDFVMSGTLPLRSERVSVLHSQRENDIHGSSLHSQRPSEVNASSTETIQTSKS
jgi:hypothetical protein